MANVNNNYQLLINKLDQFIRKYYINKLIRGFLYALGLIGFLFLTMNLLEYYFYYGKEGRKILFYSFLGISIVALFVWILVPLLNYFRLGRVISHEQAANIIGDHFGDVKDKLINVLQLKKQSDHSTRADLILASINHKSEQIKLVPFKSAIDLSSNRKYLRYALPPLLLLLIILFAAPSLIKESTKRLIYNDKDFEREAPFHFKIKEKDLTVVQFEDYPLTVTIDGEVLPDEVFIDIDNYQYRLKKESANTFSYKFNNVQKEINFKLFSGFVKSDEYKLNVLKKPNILGFDIKLDYPAYTKRQDENLSNIGDLVIPMGTNIDWIFNSQNTDNIDIKFSSQKELTATKRFSDDLFTFKKKALKDEGYKIYVSNAALPKSDSVSYSITVIPDLNPTISVKKFEDSTDNKLNFFVGEASDDYGLLSLSFNYRITKEKGGQGTLQTIKLPKPDAKSIQYDYTFDLETLELQPGDEVSYYFEVYDNDAIHGSKSARTNLMKFEMPTVEEFEEMASKNNEEIKKSLEKSIIETKKIKEDMKKLREKLLQEKEVDWQTKKEMEKLLERQKDLEKQIQQAKEYFEENKKNQDEFSETKEKILEKQERVQEMFEELMSDDMKELMEQIQELMEQLEKDEALDMMEEMEMNDEQTEMQLDRVLELLKQLELENEMEKAIDKLEELAEQEEKLSEKTEQEEKPQEDLKKEQEQINDKFDKLKEQMKDIEQMNKELENPKDIDDPKKDLNDIQKDINDSKEKLDQKENKKAAKSQKNASKKMKDMAMKMAMKMQSSEMEQMEEDMDALRQLLENLVGLSFNQEDLIKNISKTKVNTPKYIDLVQEQYKLKDEFQIVDDSLQALSKRVFQIESYVTEKVTEIKSNMKDGLENLEERRKPQAADHQQRTMKNINDLALMLSEVMNQMQQQMSGMMSGDQMCNKPGNAKGNKGGVPKDKIGSAQEQLNKQMQKMKDSLKNGGKTSSEEFAKMAKKQAALRKALREMQKEKQEQGKGQGAKELQEIIDQMNKTETDLVNKRLNNEMLKRQQNILTRLLKHEKAEREREYDNKRKAETASKKDRKMPPSLMEYIKKRESEIEMFKTVSPSLKPYYKFLVQEYFKELKKQ